MAELLAQREAASGADMVELRLDFVRDLDVAAALAGCRTPVLATCRAAWEGGRFEGSETDRLAVLRQAWDLGAAFVDVEASADCGPLLAHTGGRRVVLSWHDFEETPADLEARAARMCGAGAEVVKIAVTARRLTDVVRLAGVTGDHPAVLLAMGTPGLPSRLLPGRLGSQWTYAGDGVAPGQIALARLRHEFGVQHVTPATQLYGLLGRPVSHSISPAMHNAAFRTAGLDAIYLPLEAADFADFLAFADAFAVRGVSVTAPYKIDAFAHAADVDEDGRDAQSVNTLLRTPLGWAARNTDLEGFTAPLRAAGSFGGRAAAVLGAGGAARTVARGLRAEGMRVTVHARRAAQAEALAESSQVAAARFPPPAASWDVLVNATPVGTAPDVDASPMAGLPLDGALVYDLVYNPAETRLMRDAAAAGCRTIGGLDMLVAQAEAQFTWWTGRRPLPGVMREAATRRLAEMEGKTRTV